MHVSTDHPIYPALHQGLDSAEDVPSEGHNPTGEPNNMLPDQHLIYPWPIIEEYLGANLVST